MGTNCSCANKSNLTVENPIVFVQNPEIFSPKQQLDLVYVESHKNQPIKLQNTVIINQAEVLNSKRTSQPSLICLNKQITHMINTFQNLHGTISNELTRSNTLKFKKNIQTKASKIKQLTNEISEIQYKKKKYNEDMITGNQSIQQQNQSKNINNLLIQEQQKQNSICQSQGKQKSYSSKKKQTQEQKSQLSQQESQLSQQKNSRKFNTTTKQILDADLVNQQFLNQKNEIFLQYNSVQDNILDKWQGFNVQTFSLSLDDMKYYQNNHIFNAAFTSIIVYYQKFKILLVSYKKSTQNLYLVKLWINGSKRAMPQGCQNNIPVQIFQKSINKLYNNNMINSNPSYEIYHLGGWCPQCLLLEEITNKQNLWDRLLENFCQGNILISFCRIEDNIEYYYTLRNISNSKLVQVINFRRGLKNQNSNNNIYQYSWQQICEYTQKIYINWNPSIYSFSKKFETKWKIPLQQNPFFNEQICLVGNPQYLIKIPKHEQDFQIRIFLDRYLNKFDQKQSLSIKLYQYEGTRVLNPKSFIRSIQNFQRQLISDVFIFQKSDEVDYFILTVVLGGNTPKQKQIFYSLLYLSFIEIQIIELPRRQILKSTSIISQINPNHKGMGINSPYFLKNLHYSINTAPQSDLQIFVEAPDDLQYSLILFQDSTGMKDIAKLDFQTILTQNYTTETFFKYGYLEKQLRGQNYILVISSMNECTGNIKITANIVSKILKRNKQIEQCYSNISIQKLYFEPKILKSYEIKWSKENSGPRKRLKNTSTPIYHPISTFNQFLKNPSISVKLQKGKYQFNLTCEQYRKTFQTFKYQNIEPPALSLCILKLSQNQKGYKIISDDAFYVPIGYGYWSDEVILDDGKYTIVCTRINKSNAKGVLKIRIL